jgi:hypothetical protein
MPKAGIGTPIGAIQPGFPCAEANPAPEAHKDRAAAQTNVYFDLVMALPHSKVDACQPGLVAGLVGPKTIKIQPSFAPVASRGMPFISGP